METRELKALLGRLRSGEKEALLPIYEEFKRPVYTVALRILRSPALAEDVAQEIFLRLLRSPPGTEVRDPRPWIFRMARNLAIDVLRREARGGTLDKETEEVLSVEEGRVSDLRLDLEAAIARLSLSEREILSLHLSAGLPFREAALIAGLSLPAAYRRYRKALKVLQHLLNGGNNQ